MGGLKSGIEEIKDGYQIVDIQLFEIVRGIFDQGFRAGQKNFGKKMENYRADRRIGIGSAKAIDVGGSWQANEDCQGVVGYVNAEIARWEVWDMSTGSLPGGEIV